MGNRRDGSNPLHLRGNGTILFSSDFFESEPQLRRLQMFEGRSPTLVQHPSTLHPLRETAQEAVLFDLRQLVAAHCSQSCFKMAFRIQEE
jgi:hypothetical protein